MVNLQKKSIGSLFIKHIENNEIVNETSFLIDLADYFRNKSKQNTISITELIELLQKDNYYSNVFRKCILSNFKNLEYPKNPGKNKSNCKFCEFHTKYCDGKI